MLGKTICANCVFHVAKDQDSVRKDMWYNHFCNAQPEEAKLDIVTGKMVEVRLPFCRDINDGNCKLFVGV